MRKRAGSMERGVGGEDDPAADRQFVVALQRGLDVLRAFRPSDAALGNQDLAARTGLPKATVSRLTYTLSKLGFLDYIESAGKYRVGLSVLGLGYACLGGLNIRDTAQPLMQALADHAGEGVLVGLGGRDDLAMIYLACARSAGLVSVQLNVGSRISLRRSGMGWAYLAAATAEEREALLPRLRARTGEEAWPKTLENIDRAARDVRSHGFCINMGEWNDQIASVAVPLRVPQSDLPLMVLNCGGPAYLLSRERLEQDLGPRLVELSRKVAVARRG